jgi:hypothetical protein
MIVISMSESKEKSFSLKIKISPLHLPGSAPTV